VPSVVLARLRSGELFVIQSPQFHAISSGLISAEEVAAILSQHPKDPTFKYRASSGYHVLYDVA